jgi:hypothetical protein
MQHAVLSYGLGVDSTALILRWIFEPNTRPCPLENVTVISAMTGDEFTDTARDVTNHILPLFRTYRIRYVQVARHGAKEADGITVLSDTRNTAFLYVKGDYKLSDELSTSGVVPSYSGPHTCSMKAKAVPIETWLERFYDEPDYAHAFGYSADEPKRAAKSDEAIRRRNIAFGFNTEELGRAKRAEEYDLPNRQGFYPLIEWGWNREACKDYIKAILGVEWHKSACCYCPFAHNKQNLVQLETRHMQHPQQTAEALMLEHMSMVLNPRGTLYRDESLLSMTTRAGNIAALHNFEAMQQECPWTIYRVRRIYAAKSSGHPSAAAKKGTVQRAVEKQGVFSTAVEALDALRQQSIDRGWELISINGIQYAYVEYRKECYPTREEYYVAAPARVEDKTRYGIDAFNAQWSPRQSDLAFPCAG